MRNPARIYPLLNKIGDLWIHRPQLRFGQLVEHIRLQGKKSDLFNIEDDDFEDLIDLYGKVTKNPYFNK